MFGHFMCNYPTKKCQDIIIIKNWKFNNDNSSFWSSESYDSYVNWAFRFNWVSNYHGKVTFTTALFGVFKDFFLAMNFF